MERNPKKPKKPMLIDRIFAWIRSVVMTAVDIVILVGSLAAIATSFPKSWPLLVDILAFVFGG